MDGASLIPEIHFFDRKTLEPFPSRPKSRFYHKRLRKTGTVIEGRRLCRWDDESESWIHAPHLSPSHDETAFAHIVMQWDGSTESEVIEDTEHLIIPPDGIKAISTWKFEGRTGEIQGAAKTLRHIKPALENQYLVKGLLDRGALSVFYGGPGSGKTFVALEIAMHVAARMPWRGLRVGGQGTEYDWPGPVFYVALEGGRGVENRLSALKVEHPDLWAAASEQDMFAKIAVPMDFHAEGDADALAEMCGSHFPGLIVIDTLARAMGAGDENTASDMGQLIRNIDMLRLETGAHVSIIHHSGKDATKGARGSSALRAAADTEIEITQENGVITVAARKQREMACDFERHFSLKSVTLGVDEDGDPVNSAVLVEAEAVERKPRLTGTQEVALQALTEALAQHGHRVNSPDFPTCDLVNVDQWRSMCDRHGLTETRTDDAKRKAFARAKDALLNKHIIREFDGKVWRVSQ